jgi:hypothetical protein
MATTVRPAMLEDFKYILERGIAKIATGRSENPAHDEVLRLRLIDVK